jgi:all-trans-retinol 13,14-reductase
MVGKRAWRETMCKAFPNDVQAIDRYLSELKKLKLAATLYFADKVLSGPLTAVAGPLLRSRLLKISSATVHDVLSSITQNKRLRAVLAGQWGDYGLPPKQASWAIHAMVASHYFQGAYYPAGGAAQIAAMVEKVLERNGGRIATNAGVAEVLVEGGRAVGVKLESGQEVRAPIVCSNAGVPLTQSLLPDCAAKRELGAVRARTETSAAHVSLYVGMNRTAAELQLPKNNIWVYPGDDHDAQVAAWTKSPEADLPVAFLSFPSARDPHFLDNHPGNATLEVLTLVPYDWVSQWEDTKWKKRGADYDAFKASLSEKLLAALLEQCPQVRDHIEIAELSTPLTTKHFAGHPMGEIYGIACTPQRFEEKAMRPATKLPGMWMTGADVCSPGVAGAAIGGVLAATAISKRNLFSKAMGGPYEPKIVAAPSAEVPGRRQAAE